MHPPEVHTAQHAARAAQDTKSWQATYALRAGVEGTIHQAVAICDIRHARYRGLRKVHLQQVFSAVALNLIRLHAYWNDHPMDRTSHLSGEKPAGGNILFEDGHAAWRPFDKMKHQIVAQVVWDF